MCYKGTPLRLAAAAAANVCKKDDLNTLKRTTPTFQLRLAPPHADMSDSSCASTSTCSSTSSAFAQRRKTKKVSFQATVTIRHIPNLGSYGRKQLAAIYHTPQELMAIRNEYLRQLRIIQFEDDILEGEGDDTDICSRGLEPETKEGRRERRIHRMAAISSVLNEQLRQKKYGIVNPESIARRYSLTTKDSVYAAREKATWDALDAQNYAASHFF